MNTELAWFKSSYSDSEGGDCVEVARCPTTVHVRDSKDQAGPVLSFAAAAWVAFLAGAPELRASGSERPF
ncbi:DUF397 domain-containing protein [Kitasatospora sp. NPDC058965]|uniref:DUF397 domain-containing protein n=1 Tax=Kitasatospora sp. NPDC058965 TaxID=3346682 RepID=UPI0036757D56